MGAKQKDLPSALEAATHNVHLACASMVDRATLLSECEAGARSFWQAQPNATMGTAVASAEYVEEVVTRLCMSNGNDDGWCPLCGA
eukprot:8419090-Karenia_brevis.AAC.1